MWTKDIYEEQMLAYLGEVEADIEQFAYSRLQQYDLNELYLDLEIVNKRLWRLIGTSELDWEDFRFPLEISCDRLQRALYRLPHSDALILSTASLTLTANHESPAKLWATAEMLG